MDDCDIDGDLLSDSELLASFFPDAPSPLPAELNVEPVPVAQIQYSQPFRLTMGLYRHLSSSMRELNSPRWLLLLAFVIRRCPAHYSAWKHRRDVVLSPSVFALCCRERMIVPPAAAAAGRMWHASSEAGESLSDRQRLATSRWCPGGVEANIQAWPRVRWELEVTRYFALNNPKNFQVWHHRQELITAVFATDAAPSPASVPYAELVQELALCSKIHEEDDSKNYHLWSHRSWFLGTFSSIALRTPDPAVNAASESLQTVEILGDDIPCCSDISEEEKVFRREAFELHLAPLLAVRSDTPSEIIVGKQRVRVEANAGASSLLDELRVSASFIDQDVFNNSAWTHRFMLIRNYVLPHVGIEGQAVQHVICGEIRLALLCARECPCNESPLVYARSVSELLKSPAAGGLWRQCHLRLEALLLKAVMPRLQALEAAFATYDSNTSNSPAPLEYLRRNTFQVTACRYQIFRDVAASMWQGLDAGLQERVTVAFPASRFAYDSAARTAATEDAALRADPCVRELLTCEDAAIGCLRHLAAIDTIRSKYWRAELSDVLDRAY
jgi:protein farnesyltransferase/geranylgeranyltransferase type-1 subunit alpha